MLIFIGSRGCYANCEALSNVMFASVLRCFACVVFAPRLVFAGINEGSLTALGSWSTDDVLGLHASSSCDVAHDLGTGADSGMQACAAAVLSNGALQDTGRTGMADSLIVDLSSQPGDEVLVNADDGIESIKHAGVDPAMKNF